MPADIAVGASILIILFSLVVGLFLYFVPSFIAFGRRHPHRLAILLVNLIFGWTLIGWVGTLIWALLTPEDGSINFSAAFGDTKPCPRCAERVKRGALVCRYCGYTFGPPPPLPR